MSIVISCLLTLIVAMVVLFIAISIARRRQILEEKKAQYLNCKKKQNFHYSRYQSYQKDIERLRSDHNSKLEDIIFLSKEIETKKKVITEIIEILREEIKQIEKHTDGISTKIIERRKGMINKYWQELNGVKTAYLEKLKEVQTDKFSMESLIAKKDEEFRIYSEIQSEVENLKGEYESMLRKLVSPFRIEKAKR